MPLELTAALVAALIVGMWRLLRRRAHRRDEPFQDVPNAPPEALPIGLNRLDPHGLATYTLELGAPEDPVARESTDR